ncbi:MAG: hypothetical protein JKX81_01310 [Arenicella sp.]|nr:hypothetical protein [Arenicella sp.]
MNIIKIIGVLLATLLLGNYAKAQVADFDYRNGRDDCNWYFCRYRKKNKPYPNTRIKKLKIWKARI